MKSRKLGVQSLEDRRVPSTNLTGHTSGADARADAAVVFVPSTEATLRRAGSAITAQVSPDGKIATNHNETLVRDRRRTKRRSR